MWPHFTLLTCFRTLHRLRAATCFGVVGEGAVELDAVAFGGDIGAVTELTEDADGGAVPRDFGIRSLTAGGGDCLGNSGFR